METAQELSLYLKTLASLKVPPPDLTLQKATVKKGKSSKENIRL